MDLEDTKEQIEALTNSKELGPMPLGSQPSVAYETSLPQPIGFPLECKSYLNQIWPNMANLSLLTKT